MSIFSVNPDILDSQAGKLDQVAGDLESVSYPTGLDLGRSTSSATTAISQSPVVEGVRRGRAGPFGGERHENGRRVLPQHR